MSRTVDLIYGQTGQIVETYPEEWSSGVPSSASASVFEGEESLDNTAEFTPSVTIDPVSTTVDAASGYGQTNKSRLYLTATTNIAAGRQYLLEEDSNAVRELVTPRGIVSADYVDLEDDLKYDYSTGATFKGLRMYFTVDATWVATEANILLPTETSYKVVWTYTVNSLVRRQYTYLRLVRQVLKHGVTLRDLHEYFPDLQYEQFLGQHGEGFARMIDGAFDDFRIDVKRQGYEPSIVRDTEIVHKIVVLKTLLNAAEAGLAPGNRDVETYINERRSAYESLLSGTIAAALKVAVDQGTEGGVTRPSLQTLWFER